MAIMGRIPSKHSRIFDLCSIVLTPSIVFFIVDARDQIGVGFFAWPIVMVVISVGCVAIRNQIYKEGGAKLMLAGLLLTAVFLALTAPPWYE